MITEGFEPQVVLKNYQAMCKSISIPPNQKVVDTICPPLDGNADPVELTQLILDNSDGPLFQTRVSVSVNRLLSYLQPHHIQLRMDHVLKMANPGYSVGDSHCKNK